MRCLLLCVGLFGLLFPASTATADDEPLAAMQGTWRVVDSTVDGKRVRDRQISSSRMIVRDDELTMEPGDGSTPERFKIKPAEGAMPLAAEVNRIEPANRPQTGWQLFEVKGDRLRIAFFDALKGRPTSFEPQPKLIVIELERAMD